MTSPGAPSIPQELATLQQHRSRADKRATGLLAGVLLERLLKERAVQVLAEGSSKAREQLHEALGEVPLQRATLGDLLKGLQSEKLVGRRRAELWKVREVRNWAAHDGADAPNALVIEGCVETVLAVAAELGHQPRSGGASVATPLAAPLASPRESAGATEADRPPQRSAVQLVAMVALPVLVAAGLAWWFSARVPSGVEGVDVGRASIGPTEGSDGDSPTRVGAATAPDAGLASLPPVPPGPVSLAVLLYGDASDLPAVDDLSARRLFLAERVIPALLDASPRAIVLDFDFAGGADERSTAALHTALVRAEELDVPVVAVRPLGRTSELSVCGASPCVAALADATKPAENPIRSWPLCDPGDGATLGHVTARLLASEPGSADWKHGHFCSEPVPLRLPPVDPCQAPYQRLWVSELLTGEPYAGRDPVTYRDDVSCGGGQVDLGGRVVLVGDPRLSASGRDIAHLGDADGGEPRPFAGAEVHAVVAWNVLPLLAD